MAGTVLTLGGLGGLSVGAQTYEQVAPHTLPKSVQPGLPEALTLSASTERSDDTVLVPRLQGVIFLSDRAELSVAGRDVIGLDLTATPLLDSPTVRAALQTYLDRPLTSSRLAALTRYVVQAYREKDRLLVDVFVPEQMVTAGTVQVLVIEGRVGAVLTEGGRWTQASHITAGINVRPGDTIRREALLSDLAWINRNPFRQTDMVFSRGEQMGETNIVLRTTDRFPLRGFVGYEDTGNALTGFDRLLAGFNWGRAFGFDHQMNYQVSTSADGEKLVAHSGSYLVPIPRWRHTLTMFGSWAESHPVLEGGMFNLDGLAWQISGRYGLPLPEWRGWASSLRTGVDFKRSNNDLSFGGMDVYAQETDVIQAVVSLSTQRSDRRGLTTAELFVALSPGGLTSGNRSGAYEAARAGAQPDYAYTRLQLSRTTSLPLDLSWVMRGTAQFATSNLLGSEQLGLGGSSNLRGYEERGANGDNGLMVSNELRAAPLPLLSRWWSHAGTDQLTPLVFLDAGVVSNHKRLPGEPRRVELASVGVGLRYQLGTHVSVRGDYGWQLTTSEVLDDRRESRGHLSMVLSY